MKRVLAALALLLLAAFLYVQLVEIPRQVRYAGRTPITSSPTDVGLAFEAFQITPADADLALEGWWMPADNATATLLFLHGGTSNRDSRYFLGLEFYRALVDAGIAVAAIDLRNHGASGADTTGVQFGRTEYRDAAALVRWAREKTPGQPLYLMGISMGGATAIHALANGVQVDGLILLDPLLVTNEGLTRAVWAVSGIPPWLVSLAGWAAHTWHGFPAPGAQALDLAADLTLPVLAIQDPGDPVTPAKPLVALASRRDNIELW
ncbi:MAG: alpha/beta fold hydrolase, partial [Halioglobus sp.]|nr:alpha/beta fold hydrolase [Halioglobus sp.]